MMVFIFFLVSTDVSLVESVTKKGKVYKDTVLFQLKTTRLDFERAHKQQRIQNSKNKEQRQKALLSKQVSCNITSLNQ